MQPGTVLLLLLLSAALGAPALAQEAAPDAAKVVEFKKKPPSSIKTPAVIPIKTATT